MHRYSVPTSITAISQVLESLNGKIHLAIEEGPMAGWLYRNLRSKVNRFIVGDPRRNKLIAADGDNDDPIDAEKLAALLRGNYLRPIYHSDDDARVELKQSTIGVWQPIIWIALNYLQKKDKVRCPKYRNQNPGLRFLPDVHLSSAPNLPGKDALETNIFEEKQIL